MPSFFQNLAKVSAPNAGSPSLSICPGNLVVLPVGLKSPPRIWSHLVQEISCFSRVLEPGRSFLITVALNGHLVFPGNLETPLPWFLMGRWHRLASGLGTQHSQLSVPWVTWERGFIPWACHGIKNKAAGTPIIRPLEGWLERHQVSSLSLALLKHGEELLWIYTRVIVAWDPFSGAKCQRTQMDFPGQHQVPVLAWK